MHLNPTSFVGNVIIEMVVHHGWEKKKNIFKSGFSDIF